MHEETCRARQKNSISVNGAALIIQLHKVFKPIILSALCLLDYDGIVVIRSRCVGGNALLMPVAVILKGGGDRHRYSWGEKTQNVCLFSGRVDDFVVFLSAFVDSIPV